MKTHDPVTGPITREKFAELVAAPYGEATKVIRKFDPMYGRADGEKIKWRVKFSREITEIGYAKVEASSEKEALEIADKLSDSQISWDYDDTGLSEIEYAEACDD